MKWEQVRDYGAATRKKTKYLKTGEVFESASEASKKTGYSLSMISNMAHDKVEPKLFEYA